MFCFLHQINVDILDILLDEENDASFELLRNEVICVCMYILYLILNSLAVKKECGP